jgi:hypothetical protein
MDTRRDFVDKVAFKRVIRSFLCKLGLHQKEKIGIEVLGKTKVNGEWRPRTLTLYYDVCIHCGKGHPEKTGEW